MSPRSRPSLQSLPSLSSRPPLSQRPSSFPDLPITASCFWLADLPQREVRPALAGEQHADVAIVGGGFTGLWTALFLKELAPEKEVVLLEAERIAHGASGRNAGLVGETFDHSHGLAIQHFGEAEAARLAQLARRNLDEMEEFLTQEAIDAEFSRVGQIFLALTKAHTREVNASLAAARRLGIEDWRKLDPAETRDAIGSPLPLSALFAPRAATVHPAKLATGLARIAEKRGVRICESSAVRGIENLGDALLLSTSGGTLRAPRVVLATNAYSHLLFPRLARRFLPLYDYILTSEPLDTTQRAAIRWQGREGVTDFRSFFNYSRLTADDRVVWGTSEAVYHRGNGVGPAHDHDAAVYRELESSFVRFFPDLRALRFPFRWGGPIAATTRFTPFFGSLFSGRLQYGLGYTGHGIGTTRIAGKLLAHLALERRTELAELALVRRPPFPYPPEPLRHWSVDRVTRALRRVDAGASAGLLLRLLNRIGIGFSS
ncbi:MAG: FAD-dependent oxidoreductase [Thermoanaerobaculia bacterium]